MFQCVYTRRGRVTERMNCKVGFSDYFILTYKELSGLTEKPDTKV